MKKLGLEAISAAKLKKIKLAYLMGQGLTQNEAQGKLNIKNPVEAHRAKKEALKNDWLRMQFNEDYFEDDLLTEIREDANHRQWQNLQSRLNLISEGTLKSIWVFYSGDNTNPDNDLEWDFQIRNLARNSSGLILKMLLNSKSGVGVAWGKTVSNVVVAIEERLKLEILAKSTSQRKIQIIPTVGTPPSISDEVIEKSSTRLAKNLSEALNGTRDNVPSLKNADPVLRGGLSEEERRGYCFAIEDHSDYEKIFGKLNDSQKELSQGKKPLIKVIDTILTSCGAFHSESYFQNQLIARGGLTGDYLKRHFKGDIGSALIPSGIVINNTQDKKKFENMLNLLTGINLGDYQEIARRATKNTDPNPPSGVILTAINDNKANIVLDCVKHKAVNVLIVDYHLANTLTSLLDKEERK
jgi:DNA-binding transcriptional regulator LsrR (DeoR family)